VIVIAIRLFHAHRRGGAMPFSVEVAVATKLRRADSPAFVLGAGPDIGCRILLETRLGRYT
jgi:hypothetical protein